MRRKILNIFCVLLFGLSILTVGFGLKNGRASAAPAAFPRALVSVTFDDNYESQYANAVPFLNSLGLKATFYVVTFDIDNEPDYMTLDQLKDVKKNHEIASHSVNHPDLTTLDATQLNAELYNSWKTLEDNALGPVYNFACPNGAYNDTTLAATKQYYVSNREGWGDGMNTVGNFDPYRIHARLIEPATTAEDVAGWLAQATADKTWLVLIYHEVSDNPLDPNYCVSIANFQAQAQAIQAAVQDPQKMAAVTVKEALDELMPLFTYNISASVPAGHGTALPDAQTVTCGQNATINLTPEAGYHVASITDNGDVVPGPYGATYTINKVTADHNVVVTFEATSAPFTVTSITPNNASQFALFVGATITGTGFDAGVTVRFEKGATIMPPFGANVDSDTQITCTLLLFGNEPGTFDVVVSKPGVPDARLSGSFTIVSPCGQGSGTGILMLGISLGLLSLAGSFRSRRKRRAL